MSAELCERCPLRVEGPAIECTHGPSDWHRAKDALIRQLEEKDRQIASLAGKVQCLALRKVRKQFSIAPHERELPGLDTGEKEPEGDAAP